MGVAAKNFETLERGWRANDGLTLLEILIAAGVMTIGVSLLFGSISSIVVTNTITERRQIAMSQVSTVLEDLGTCDFDEVMAYAPPAMTGLGDESAVTVAVFNAGGAAVDLPIADPAVQAALPNPLTIRVTISWRDNVGRVSSTASSAVFRME